ncbi:MAG TPA: glycerol-3-phosphate 1-O-acyltransferase PlsY [Candidatus Acidoferrales bacterium]|nr:glycerol-3-phosphate 1-O-acyltransferase PlsY [Candidatus Acidoferrales bacterium]
MSTSTYIFVAVFAYLLGSIPFGYLLVRSFTGTDVRSVGSGNIGATNVARTGRKGLAISTLFLDAAKGYLAVALVPTLVRHIHADAAKEDLLLLSALAALFAIIGHMFTFWLKFKGGKGVATGFGVFLALAPVAVGIVMIFFFFIFAVTRYVSLSSIVASGVFPLVFWATERTRMTPPIFVASAIAAFLIVYRHKENIHRLVTGTEHRFGAKKA